MGSNPEAALRLDQRKQAKLRGMLGLCFTISSLVSGFFLYTYQIIPQNIARAAFRFYVKSIKPAKDKPLSVLFQSNEWPLTEIPQVLGSKVDVYCCMWPLVCFLAFQSLEITTQKLY